MRRATATSRQQRGRISMLRVTLEDDCGSYTVDRFKHDDTIKPVIEAFISVLLAAGYHDDLISKFIETEGRGDE